MSSTSPEGMAQYEFIQQLFASDFGVSSVEVTTLPRCNNNFLHFVTFPSAFTSEEIISDQAGTSPIPHGTVKAVVRIGNPDSMFNHAVKVENTVAVMQLLRTAFSNREIIPRVYAWSKAGGPFDNGWIVEQYLPGAEIEADFHKKLSPESQRHVLGQIAEVLKTVQDFQLPATCSQFGGLAFDQDHNVISAPFVVEPYTGPFAAMKIFYKKMLEAQLKEADRSPVARGWKENRLRERLDAFADKGLESILSNVLTQAVEPRLIIGDVVIANFLFDPTTYDVLGLVDYDCSHTGHPLHEFFFSSFSVSYYALAPDAAVTDALFHGYPSPLPTSVPTTSPEYVDGQSPQWEVMAIFEEELKRVGAARPSSIEGAERIAEVYGFMSKVCPFHFVMERWISRQTEEKLQAVRTGQEEKISRALEGWGF
ncbi:phosphotransferase enzyme family protein [Phlyctema vagabunda]|uniref:Phosphotransferase enzyme family protein n=1 Tax=Phlyctema vagabunda TaxID=108571 RepID=A0ABR4P5Z9_9HELO